MILKKLISLTLAFSFLFSLIVVAQPAFATTVDADTIKKRKVIIHRSLLNIYKKQGRTDDAMREFPVMIGLTPDDSRLRYEYGVFLARSNKKGEAVNQLKKAVSMEPANADYAGALGTTLVQMKNYPEGCKYLRQAVSCGGDKYKKVYDDAYKFIQYQKQREVYLKKQEEYKKKLEARKKLIEARKNGEDEEDDDW